MINGKTDSSSRAATIKSSSSSSKITNDDQRRKIKHLEEKKRYLKEKNEEKRFERFAKIEATRFRARVAADSFYDIFDKSSAVNDMKELIAGANGETKTTAVVRGISLDEI
jgi:hypothetical protein